MPSPRALLILALVVLVALIAYMASTCHGGPNPNPPKPIYTTSEAETTEASAPQTIQETNQYTNQYTLPATGGPSGAGRRLS